MELKNSSRNLEVFEMDVSKPSSLASFASQLGDRPIDVFINNAGVYGPKKSSFGGLKADEWLGVLNINSVAPILLTEYLVNNLREGEQKKIIYITSKMGSVGDNQGGGSHIYRSSKAALNAAAKSVAVDLLGEGFVVGIVHPGWVRTDMGGPNGLIDTETSVKGMLDVIDNLVPENSGEFVAYDGKSIPW